MGDLVNLRTVRKRTRRRQEAERGEEQRRRHGIAKAQRSLLEARARKARRDLEQHRIETGDGQ